MGNRASTSKTAKENIKTAKKKSKRKGNELKSYHEFKVKIKGKPRKKFQDLK